MGNALLTAVAARAISSGLPGGRSRPSTRRWSNGPEQRRRLATDRSASADRYQRLCRARSKRATDDADCLVKRSPGQDDCVRGDGATCADDPAQPHLSGERRSAAGRPGDAPPGTWERCPRTARAGLHSCSRLRTAGDRVGHLGTAPVRSGGTIGSAQKEPPASVRPDSPFAAQAAISRARPRQLLPDRSSDAARVRSALSLFFLLHRERRDRNGDETSSRGDAVLTGSEQADRSPHPPSPRLLLRECDRAASRGGVTAMPRLP
jgi:hypothetical protein